MRPQFLENVLKKKKTNCFLCLISQKVSRSTHLQSADSGLNDANEEVARQYVCTCVNICIYAEITHVLSTKNRCRTNKAQGSKEWNY